MILVAGHDNSDDGCSSEGGRRKEGRKGKKSLLKYS